MAGAAVREASVAERSRLSSNCNATIRAMPLHPEEMRIAGALRELLVHAETLPEVVEGSLGWRAGRLRELLAGRDGMSMRELLELLQELNTTPSDFFSRLYTGSASEVAGDGRFAESKRVVRDALFRRRTWKKERGEE
jgi:hypothetical protein